MVCDFSWNFSCIAHGLSRIGLQYVFKWIVITLAMVCNTLAKFYVLFLMQCLSLAMGCDFPCNFSCNDSQFLLQWFVLSLAMACGYLAMTINFFCNDL